MRIDVMGVFFDNVTLDEAVQAALQMLKQPGTSYCVTPNAEIVYESLFDTELRQILNDADLILPDGAGIVLGAKILKTPLKQKVAGVDFAAELIRRIAQNGQTLYLLGGKPDVAETASKNLQARYPGLIVCGTHDGYFKDAEPIIQEINAAHPDVLFVCLGAPKQERFMASHRAELCTGLMAGLGGSLDSFAGTVKRAPKWMIRCNLEWLYRLIKEPWRLRRMMRLPKFLFRVIGARRKGGGADGPAK